LLAIPRRQLKANNLTEPGATRFESRQYRLLSPPWRGLFCRNAPQVLAGTLASWVRWTHGPSSSTATGATEPRRGIEGTRRGSRFCVGAWLTSGGREMNLWKTFNSEVDGKVFWPVIIVMLLVLVPIVLALK